VNDTTPHRPSILSENLPFAGVPVFRLTGCLDGIERWCQILSAPTRAEVKHMYGDYPPHVTAVRTAHSTRTLVMVGRVQVW
jgi:hypothetical protein